MRTRPKPGRARALRAPVLGAALAVLCLGVWGSAPAHGASCQIRSSVPEDRLASLSRGFNLTGWLDQDLARRPDPAALAALHARGFTHVRLPVPPESLMEAFSTLEEISDTLAALDETLDRLLGIGYAVSLDLHPGEKLQALQTSDPERAFLLLKSLWQHIARRYAGKPADSLFFEVLNEPVFEASVWASKGPRLIDAIRREAPDHTIVYTLSGYQRADELDGKTLPDAQNVVYAVHFYDPMVFTHQGLNWSDDPLQYLHDVPFPARLTDARVGALLESLRLDGHDKAAKQLEEALAAPWGVQRIAKAIGQAGDWAERNGVPVIVNEFGVLAWKAPPADRIRWLAAVSGTAAANCLGWAIWDYADGFGFMERVAGTQVPDEAVLTALLGRQTARKAASSEAVP